MNAAAVRRSAPVPGLPAPDRPATPLLDLKVRVGDVVRRARVKLEMRNPTGSIKDRTALGLLSSLHEQRPLQLGDRVVESTSGNLGLALARYCGEAGLRFTAVTDPKTAPDVIERMAEDGAEIVRVDSPDEHGGYLLTRLATVRDMLRDDPGLRWTDQYHNPAALRVHRATAAELVRQCDGRVDAVYVTVSTGGTLAGIAAGLRHLSPAVTVHAVDVLGSVAVGGTGFGHVLSGIGASRRASLVRPADYRHLHRVLEARAIAMCRLLRAQTGWGLGASTGAVLAAFVDAAADHPAGPVPPVLVSPDGAANYLTTIYDDPWLASRRRYDAVRAELAEAQARGVRFTVQEEKI